MNSYFITGIIGLVYAFAEGRFGLNMFAPTIVALLVTLLYAAICWQLLVKSKNVADFIYEKSAIGTSFKIISKPSDLLFILFIIVGFCFLLQELPFLIKAFVNAFKTKAGSRFELPDYDKPTDWTILFLKLLLPVILLMAARPIANYFAKNVSDEPVTIGDDIGNTDEKEITEP